MEQVTGDRYTARSICLERRKPRTSAGDEKGWDDDDPGDEEERDDDDTGNCGFRNSPGHHLGIFFSVSFFLGLFILWNGGYKEE
jgi:hypothetical protein